MKCKLIYLLIAILCLTGCARTTEITEDKIIAQDVVELTCDTIENATIQYYISTLPTTSNAEYVITQLLKGWENEEVDIILNTSMDYAGREQIALSKPTDEGYEIRAYQNVGLDYMAYVSIVYEADAEPEQAYAEISSLVRAHAKTKYQQPIEY